MPTLVHGNSPAVLELKSASLTALALILRSGDLDQIGQALQQRLGDTPNAFDNDPVVVDLSNLAGDPGISAPGSGARAISAMDDLFDADASTLARGTAVLDFPALVALLRRYGLQAVAVRGGTAAQTQAALAAGLADAPDGAPDAARQDARKAPAAQEAAPEVVREVIREVEVIREIPAPPPRTVVIDKPLRSGQRVYAKGADLVVLAVVNHGAEVIADGNIHVYAPLRGKAIAGARGNVDARIYANSLEAELLAIAGIYRTTEEPLPAAVQGKPAQVRLEGEKLIMQALVE